VRRILPSGNRSTVKVTLSEVASFKLRSRGIADIAEANDVLAAMKAGGAVTVIIQSSPFVNARSRV
jgi:hypothetical protein